jgi:dienelactone hydrolase
MTVDSAASPAAIPEAFRPETVHRRLIEAAPLRLAYRDGLDVAAWSAALRAKIVDLLGMPTYRGDAEIRLGQLEDRGDHTRSRLVFTAEPGAEVPCWLLRPKSVAGPLPVMICLQGHTSGMHVSLGEEQHEGDRSAIAGDRDFGLQAVRHGYAALVLEMRAFGERRDDRPAAHRRTHDLAWTDDNRTCKHAAMTALLLGRTLLGERVFDLSRACDVIATLDDLDAGRICCVGQSGGGTVAWWAAAAEPRIAAVMVASCFATVASSIASIDHCTDNYLPGMLEWLEFADVAGAIAPRKALVVMGRKDHLFPLAGVEAAFEQAQRIYRAAGAAGGIDLVLGAEGHRFYAAEAWPAFERLLAR